MGTEHFCLYLCLIINVFIQEIAESTGPALFVRVDDLMYQKCVAAFLRARCDGETHHHLRCSISSKSTYTKRVRKVFKRQIIYS
uniref:Secreted protein n=1 Tax=Astyanax mexicanus TaxID=7994 RepID=A0A3B1IFD8_ASTMX